MLVKNELACNPERMGKRGTGEQVFEHGFWSMKETKL
jgi:hypothetical protein